MGSAHVGHGTSIGSGAGVHVAPDPETQRKTPSLAQTETAPHRQYVDPSSLRPHAGRAGAAGKSSGVAAAHAARKSRSVVNPNRFAARIAHGLDRR